MELSLFDLHCDTAYEMHRRHLPLATNPLAVSLDKAACFAHYVQVMAHWTPPTVSDTDGWTRLLSVYTHLSSDPSVTSGKVQIVHACPDTPPKPPTLLLSLEDARILDGDLSRISVLYDMGFRIVTPLWRGYSSIGGAHDTKAGLSSFGKKAISKMLAQGILLDVSHASERSFDEMLAMASERAFPCIASHSNAYTVCPVSRNLRDEQIKALLLQSGIIGINLCRDFLRSDRQATKEDVLRHIEYFAQAGCEDALCLGCDLDGADTPRDVSDLSALPLLANELLKRNYSEAFIRGLFFENAFSFAKKHIKKPRKA